MTYNFYSRTLDVTEDEEDDDDYWNQTSSSRANKKPQKPVFAVASHVNRQSISQSSNSVTTAPNTSGDTKYSSVRDQLFNDTSSRTSHGSFSSKPSTTLAYGSSASSNPSGRSSESEESRKRIEHLQQQMIASSQRTAQSSRNTVQILYDTENVGVETANELSRQGEQLTHVEGNLDNINRDLNQSKRYITGMKSWFGGIKNRFSGQPDNPPNTITGSSSYTEPVIPKTVGYTQNQSASGHSRVGNDSRVVHDGTAPEWKQILQQNEEVCNENLSELGVGLDRLRNLANGLGNELDKQNETIDRLNYKTEGNNMKIQKFNKDLGTMLK